MNGIVYPNNSFIHITKIQGLKCVTDRMPCCATPPNRFGEWYFPDKTRVPIQGHGSTFYRNRGDDGSVNLNRQHNNILEPFGQFCCQLPDATNAAQQLCVTIGNFATCPVE
jgi:hypothetical protein